MNQLELLNLIKDQIDYTTFNKINNDFMDDFATEYKKARYTAGTAKKAIQEYIANANYKDETTPGVYATPATILMIAENQDIKENEKTDAKKGLAKMTIEMLKNRRPTECYFIESVILYKQLKKQADHTYYLRVGDRYYNPALINEMLKCIVTNKEKYIRAGICENGALFIQQDGAAALILPYMWKECYFANNVNFRDYLEFTKTIENDLLNDVLKTA